MCKRTRDNCTCNCLPWEGLPVFLVSIADVNYLSCKMSFTEILSPFEISYQIFILTLAYLAISFFQKFTLPKLSFYKPYLTNFFFQMLGNFTSLRSLSTDSVLTWPNDDVNCQSAVNKTKEASHWTSTWMISKLWL